MLLDYQEKRLAAQMQQSVAQKKQRFIRLTSAMDAMSPLKVLARGYAMAKNTRGHVLTDAAAVQAGETVTVQLYSGQFDAVVTAIQGGNYGRTSEEL